ncbi:2'-5' RNA ligase [Sphingomonas guangdongensis]|uniref:RNA 2',3'-cyclic phosphodiesterase n=1 Tax=Sphingomonas guangdongensis TaxID=1141890 RepID=A0A285QGW5_9SPHN|nr:RNA 2',3'-cyclic phosphodiesterase [Sphingomonas guangdongensis]SOB79357.1 2'-5' RNA ligase [Sphingomonas guangdongensis]
MHRLFIGLRLPPPIREQLLDLSTGVAGARWQDEDQLHVTLRFIGEVDRRVAEDVADVLATVRAPALTLRLDGVGQFDSGGRVNALWAGIAPREPITALHRKIDAALVRLGLAPERRAYLPHVTVARLNRSAGPTAPWSAQHAGLSSAPFALEHFTLFESHLLAGSAHYEAIMRYLLH